jgi:hypothetical protein
MRARRLAGIRVGLALVLAGCSTSATGTAPAQEGTRSDDPASQRLASARPVASPAYTPSPKASAPAPSSDAVPSLNAVAIVVRDAALATAEAGTLRFLLELRSADPSDDVPQVTGRGQVSFTKPIQFRYLADEFTGIGGTAPESEVIFDDSRIYTRGRDGVAGSPEAWVVLDFDELAMGSTLRQRYLEQYGTTLFVLVPALGVTHAERAGNQTINGASTTHYVGRSNPEVALTLLPSAVRELYRQSLDRRRTGIEVRGGSGPLPSVEVEVWVDADGQIARLRYLQDVESDDIEAFLITYDFDAFGAPMDLDPPNGAEILTMAELQERYRTSSAPPSPPG